MTTTPTTQFIEAKVNEGRFLSALSLEEQVLADGVLPNSPVMERLSLVKGILTGLLEQGRWQDAVQRVYTDGSIVRGLFDGDWADFRQGVLESAKRKGDGYLSKETVDLLLRHKESSLLYNLITELPVGEGLADDLLENEDLNISKQQRQQAYSSLGQRMLKEKDLLGKSPKYQQAYRYFVKADDRDAIDLLYQTLFNKIRLGGVDEAKEVDINLLISMAEFNLEKAPERVEQVVSALLSRPELLPERWDNRTATQVYELARKYKIPLPPQDKRTLMTVLAKGLAEWDLERLKDPELSLLWAQHHAEKCPSKAYAIFLKQNYEGEEVLTAVKSGLTGSQYKLELTAIRKKDLEAAYSSLPLGVRVAIAADLKDQEKLRELSRELVKKSSPNDYHALTAAYRLWLEGNGKKDDPYFINLRTTLIEKELSGVNPSFPFGPSFTFLDRDDQAGQREAFALVLERFPVSAYNLAARIEDETLLQQARQGIVARNPVQALRYFQGEGTSRIEKDSVGLELALTALEQKYKIPRQRIEQYLEKGK